MVQGVPTKDSSTNGLTHRSLHTEPVEPSQEKAPPQVKYPSEARHLIDHVVYLPVHKKVPFYYLERICIALDDVTKKLAEENQGSLNRAALINVSYI